MRNYFLCLLLILFSSNSHGIFVPFAMMRAPFRDFAPMAFPEGDVVDMGYGLGFVMQADGNMVLYGPSGVLWASGTFRSCNLQCSA